MTTPPETNRLKLGDNVPKLKTRTNGGLLFPLVIQLVLVVVIWPWASAASAPSDEVVRGFFQGLAKAGLLESVLAILIKWQKVEQRTARGIEFLGKPIAIAREGLNFLWRWERLSECIVTSRAVTKDMKTEDVQDQNLVTLNIEFAMKYQAVWTDEGISAALYGFSDDIEGHISQSLRSALADFCGETDVEKIPQCQKDLETAVERYFADFAFEQRFGHRLIRAEYKGLSSEYADALAAKRVERARADGVREKASGESDAKKKLFDADAYGIQETGKAEKERRVMLAEADALRPGKVIAQLKQELPSLAKLSAQEEVELVGRVTDYIGRLDYNAAIRAGAGDKSTVIFASNAVPGVQLDEAALRSTIYRTLTSRMSPAEDGTAAAAATTAAQAGQ
jgi:regulator of protease activity HflC (stomatin/prohibitin superfamily)